MDDPKTIRETFRETTAPLLSRLNELQDDDIRERDGLGRTIAPKEAEAERLTLLRQYERAEQQAQSAMDNFLATSRGKVEAARSALGDDQERIADMMQADQLARQGADAGDLVGRAQGALRRGDTRSAIVHLNAARLAANGQRVIGLPHLVQEVEAAMDAAVPARRDALDAHRLDRFMYADELIERTKTRQLVAVLTGDRATASRASAAAKLRQYDLARAKGEPYEDTVEMEPVGAKTPITVSGG